MQRRFETTCGSSPFARFASTCPTGVSYDVRHPELIYVSRREVIVALEVGEDDVPERSAHCNPMHITNIEPLDGTERNGRQAQRE